MDISLIRRVLEQAQVTPLHEIIPSTMGEPLLYEYMDEIINLCDEYGVRLNLTTNGTFPKGGAYKWAEKIVPVASDVKISWNGACKDTQESIMQGSQWNRMLENVKIFIEVRDSHAGSGGNRSTITFQMTFLELNAGEIPGIVKLAAELGVDRVKGHHVWTHFPEIEHLSMRRNSEAISRWNTLVQVTRQAAEQHRLSDGRKVILDNIFPIGNDNGEITFNSVCPFLGKEAWINTEGRFDPCCAPDALRRMLGDFGNLYETTLDTIWQGAAYKRLQQDYMKNELCRTCNMRRPADK